MACDVDSTSAASAFIGGAWPPWLSAFFVRGFFGWSLVLSSAARAVLIYLRMTSFVGFVDGPESWGVEIDAGARC